MPPPARAGDLSPRLARLATPQLRVASLAKQSRALGLAAEGPGSLLREGGRVLVSVRFDRGAVAALGDLRATGARVVDASQRYQTVTAAVRPADLREVSVAPGVTGVTPVLAPFLSATCPSGDIVSQGDAQLRADAARTTFGVDGSGGEVGILSDSFDEDAFAATHAPEDLASGDLPGAGGTCGDTPVHVLEDLGEPDEATDEGRAMAQIVHDLAPGADLSFATAFNGELSFAAEIEALVAAGADVLADDVFYFEEPFFQDGPIAVAVGKAVAGDTSYFSAAGNNNLIDAEGHDIASWETPGYRDAGGCPVAVQSLAGANGTHCLDFDPGSQTDRTLGMKVGPGKTLTVDLQWDEPWFGVGTDLDAFLLNSAGSLIQLAAEDNVAVSQKPVEILQWVNESTSPRIVQLVVNRFSGGAPRLKLALLQNGSGVSATEYPTSSGGDVVGPTVFGHGGAAAAISVGAVPFDNPAEPEKYSSRGPVTHDFGPVSGSTPAAPLPSSEVLSKPDVVATDCVATTFFPTPAGEFCGTSAAAPHAAAVAALMLDAEATATPAELRTALFASSVPVGAFDPCAVGAGLVEAEGAIEALLLSDVAIAPECPPPSPEVPVEDARAPGDWGSEGSTSPPPGPSTSPPTSTQGGSVQAVAPRTFFRSRPRKRLRIHGRTTRVVFRFGSNVSDASFVCRIDGGLFRPCPRNLTRRFGLGWHTLQVVARDAAGNVDRSAAVYRFLVKRAG
jgi:Subtilase family